MKRRQKFGQHFLISEKIAKSIVSSAKITSKDIVLEIGTGRGILIPLLCDKAKKVVSIEFDKKLYQDAFEKYQKFSNLELKSGDGFQSKGGFNILVSNLPYSQTRKAFEWLIQQKYSRAVLMVQKEFADKLFAAKKGRRAISVLVNHACGIEKISDVNKNNFFPVPKVNSTVLRLTRKQKISPKLIDAVNQLFSQRRKKLENILRPFGIKIESSKRLDDLTNEEIIKIAKNTITK